MSSKFSGEVRRTQSNPSLPFLYSSLSPCHIRILELFPGQPDSPLEISLKEYCHSAVECGYEALSCVWGDPKHQVSITCNNAELKITKNVQIALCQLRSPDKLRMLWVDAICINQEDIVERTQQVILMKEIYPRADKVLIWLGEMSDKDEFAIIAIDEWASFNRKYQHHSDATQFSRFEEQFVFKPGYRKKFDAVGRLTYRPWFNRCWTFQEILLSTKAELLVGKFKIEWDNFYHALQAFPLHVLAEKVLNFNALLICHGKAEIKNIASTNSDTRAGSRSLSRILQITRNSTAIDPRDKIFSMLSISVMKNPYMFRPNYRIRTRETFINLTFAMILDENSLNVIINCGEKKRDKNLPSWCPDWSCERGVTLTGYHDYMSYDINAGIKPHFENLEMNEDFELELEGALIDVVDKIFDLEALRDKLKTSAKNGTFVEVLSEFISEKGLKKYLHQDQLSLEGVLLRTLSADHWFFGPHLLGSHKKYWFSTHYRFQDLKRSKHYFLTPKIEINSSAINTRSSLESNEFGNSKNAMSQSSLDIRKMRSLPSHLNKDSGVSFDTEPEDQHRDNESESPFTHAVIEKVYGQASLFYKQGQDLDEAKKIDFSTLSAIANEAISQVLFFVEGKKLLISKRGYLAIGQDNTKVGDSFCSFLGADVPFIIRKKKKPVFEKIFSKFSKKEFDTGPDMYEIIGECYIDGIMYGELFQNVNRSKEQRYEILRKTERSCAHQMLKPRSDTVEMKKFRIS